MKKEFNNEKDKLNELVEIIREDLNEIEMITIGSLIVLDVHAKDVVEDLVKQNTSNLEAFEWVSQLRYYIQNNSELTAEDRWRLERETGTLAPVDVHVKMITTSRLYGWEYLGNQNWLVITPLTDWCYRTLMGAL